MMKITIVCLALCAVALAETSFEVAHKHPRNTQAVSKPGVEVSRPDGPMANTFYIPPDSGGNWGDNIWRNRVASDKLVSTEVQINAISNSEQMFNWNANFPGKSITHIRFLNIGRQRAYVESVSSSGGPTASAVVRISPNQQFRLLIEVYAR